MHYLMLVTLSMPPDSTSLDVRKEAQTRLSQDDSFCGPGGRFGAPLCDWFVLGGRWSGHLQETLLRDAYRDALKLAIPEMAKDLYPADLAVKHEDQLNQIWRQVGGRGSSPHTRSSYDLLGQEDDAILVNQALYDEFLGPYAGQKYGDNPKFADLDDEPVTESFIGRKWLVVIDYHN